jgi:adenylate kinase
MSLDSAQRFQLILLFGGPGAGKGTQARLLSATLGLPHISSGDLLRAEYGAAQNVMAQGDLLPDDMVTRLVLARLEQPDAKRGAVLDGFPRTLGQALELDTWLGRRGGDIRAAVYLDVSPDVLVQRIAVRHERHDDRPDVAVRRVQVFLHELPPVLEHYAALNRLHRVDGSQSVERVHQQIIRALMGDAAPGA